MAITPTREQITEFLGLDLEGEIVMLNLLKSKAKADGAGADGTGDADAGSGEAAYQRYGDAVRKMVEERGGRLVYAGRARHTLIGEGEPDEWDVVALVAYPSREAFIDMTSKPEYGEAHRHREAGLERTVLVCTQPGAGFEAGGG
jgi:uncharacterized protein (DUF1330 family)